MLQHRYPISISTSNTAKSLQPNMQPFTLFLDKKKEKDFKVSYKAAQRKILKALAENPLYFKEFERNSTFHDVLEAYRNVMKRVASYYPNIEVISSKTNLVSEPETIGIYCSPLETSDSPISLMLGYPQALEKKTFHEWEMLSFPQELTASSISKNAERIVFHTQQVCHIFQSREEKRKEALSKIRIKDVEISRVKSFSIATTGGTETLGDLASNFGKIADRCKSIFEGKQIMTELFLILEKKGLATSEMEAIVKKVPRKS